MKHLNPRQGITTNDISATHRIVAKPECETPKSPPGDYNYVDQISVYAALVEAQSVKHLNPRQGITTQVWWNDFEVVAAKACETPKSPPGDYNQRHQRARADAVLCGCETPKSPPGDYNRARGRASGNVRSGRGVKHLNPRQGITTFRV